MKLPPTRASLAGRFRRTWRSRKALKGVSQWILDVGVPIGLLVGLLYVLAARAESPSEVYQVFALLRNPEHVLLWFASVIGWLLVPALIGGVAGHVIAKRIDHSKAVAGNAAFTQRRLAQRLSPPRLIDELRPWFHGTHAQQGFVDAWVRVAHRNDWQRAQDHWELFVMYLMSREQYALLDRHECLRQAQNTAKMVLRFTSLTGQCLVCERRR
ncbi:DUF6313 family protein [Streptomyces sp. NPDC001770]